MGIGNPLGIHEEFLKTIGNTDNRGVFAFAKLDLPKNFMLSTDLGRRCDYYSDLALVGFHKWSDGVCNCGLTDIPSSRTGGHFELEALSALFVVVDASPAGLICYFEFEDENYEDFMVSQRGNTCTRTLQEQFRFLIEWKYAHEYLDNNEEISVTATEMLKILNIPTDIENWILTDCPAEKVNRFLSGNTEALLRTTEPIPDLTEEFKTWLLNKFIEAKPFGEHKLEEEK